MISIIIPVIRPEKAKRCIASIHENAGIPRHQYEIITEVDEHRIGCPKMVKRLVEKTRYDLICFLGDDTRMAPDCLKNALLTMNRFPDGWGLVALNEQNPRKHRATASHFLAHKTLLPPLGGEFFSTAYRHAYCDNELADRAMELGRYAFAQNAVIIHDHPINGGERDADYDRVYRSDNVRHDHRLYLDRKLKAGRSSLAIGLPLVESRVPVQFMASFLVMDKPDFTLLMPTFPVGTFAGNIADARNSLVTQALDEHCTHLLMMDTDQIYPPDTIAKLMGHSQPVVGTPVHRRWPPFDPILYRGKPGQYVHVPDGECYSGAMVPVDATGCGCILYDLRVFFDLEMPWFKIEKLPDGKTLGEDLGLCARLRENDVPIYVDTSIEIGHLTTYQVNRSTYELFKKFNQFQYREAA